MTDVDRLVVIEDQSKEIQQLEDDKEELEEKVAWLTAELDRIRQRNDYIERVHDDTIATLTSTINNMKAVER